jgi:hypothetical protein
MQIGDLAKWSLGKLTLGKMSLGKMAIRRNGNKPFLTTQP